MLYVNILVKIIIGNSLIRFSQKQIVFNSILNSTGVNMFVV